MTTPPDYATENNELLVPHDEYRLFDVLKSRGFEDASMKMPNNEGGGPGGGLPLLPLALAGASAGEMTGLGGALPAESKMRFDIGADFGFAKAGTMKTGGTTKDAAPPPPPTAIAPASSPRPQGQTSRKRRGWKKPEGKPSRPLSAYNLFFQAERERIMKSRSDKSTKADQCASETDDSNSKDGKDGASSPSSSPAPTEDSDNKKKSKTTSRSGIGFARLAQTIAARWKSLSASERSLYESSAAEDKVRYERELEAWSKTDGYKRHEEQKKKARAERDARRSNGGSADSGGGNVGEGNKFAGGGREVHNSGTLRDTDGLTPLERMFRRGEERGLGVISSMPEAEAAALGAGDAPLMNGRKRQRADSGTIPSLPIASGPHSLVRRDTKAQQQGVSDVARSVTAMQAEGNNNTKNTGALFGMHFLEVPQSSGVLPAPTMLQGPADPHAPQPTLLEQLMAGAGPSPGASRRSSLQSMAQPSSDNSAQGGLNGLLDLMGPSPSTSRRPSLQPLGVNTGVGVGLGSDLSATLAQQEQEQLQLQLQLQQQSGMAMALPSGVLDVGGGGLAGLLFPAPIPDQQGQQQLRQQAALQEQLMQQQQLQRRALEEQLQQQQDYLMQLQLQQLRQSTQMGVMQMGVGEVPMALPTAIAAPGTFDAQASAKNPANEDEVSLFLSMLQGEGGGRPGAVAMTGTGTTTNGGVGMGMGGPLPFGPTGM